MKLNEFLIRIVYYFYLTFLRISNKNRSSKGGKSQYGKNLNLNY
jgi:hypothetical protein